MGYTKHNSIIVTSWSDLHIETARNKAIEIFEKQCEEEAINTPYGSRIVSEIITGLANSQYSFFIAPDGGNGNLSTSNNCYKARKKFLDWLQEKVGYCEFVEIHFGGDDKYEYISRTSNEN